MSSPPSLGGGMPSGSKKFRHAILKNLLLGLRKEGGAAASRGMTFAERKDAIRHAADAALATARGAAPRWSRSLAAELAQGRRCRPRDDDAPHLLHAAAKGAWPSDQCKKVSRRRPRARPKSRAAAKEAGAIARAMVRRRARALREIVPGGKGMTDECALLGETLDYAVSLKAQVDAMQLLLRTLQQAPKNPTTSMLKQHH